MKTKLIVNFDDPIRKRDMLKLFGGMTGVQSLEYGPHKPRRSNAANAYWHGVIVEMFREYNRQQDQILDHDDCHDILKRELLPLREFTSPRTGKVMTLASDSHTLDIEAFGSLIESAVAYLAEMGVVVPDPYEYGGMERKAG